MTNPIGHEAATKQLQTNLAQSGLVTKKLQKKFAEYSDLYSVIERDHIKLVDINKPSPHQFRWDPDGHTATNIIIDKSGYFGPKRLIEVEVGAHDEYRFEFDIQKVHVLNSVQDDCFEAVRREKELEHLTIQLCQGSNLSYSQLESISLLSDSHNIWEERPEFQIFALIQYWAFYHKEAIDWLHQEEVQAA
ncbi:MAG: hypothetical protein ABJO57_14990 [Lentilitoribacter sp.]